MSMLSLLGPTLEELECRTSTVRLPVADCSTVDHLLDSRQSSTAGRSAQRWTVAAAVLAFAAWADETTTRPPLEPA